MAITGLLIVIFLNFQMEGLQYSFSLAELGKTDTFSMHHKILPVEGYDVHYFVAGHDTLPALVFLHPAFSDHKAFNFQVSFFSKKYRVIMLDMLGHGMSKPGGSSQKIDITTQHIKAILEKENAKNTHFVGVSVGSLMAQYFALSHPESVLSLTSVGGYNINLPDNEIQAAQRNSNILMVLRAVFSMNSFRGKAAELSTFTEQGRKLFFESSKAFTRKSFLVMQGLEKVIQTRSIKKTPYPVLLLTGEHDLELAKQASVRWNQVAPECLYKEIKNAGHCANMDQPEEFNKVVSEFLEQVHEKNFPR